MKSLDEVINALSICHQTDTHRLCKGCPYPDDSGCLNALLTDAFDWLRIYQDEIIQYRKDLRNDPLDWETLKQMEGKPIWVEADYFEKGWFLVDASLVDIWVTGYDCAEHQLREEDIGVSWQAYRKERE